MTISETPRRHATPSRIGFFLCAFALFATSLGYCALIARVFVYGIVAPDTGPYLELATNFHVLHYNNLDWARTIPFGALLRFALLFPNPTITVYWICCLLFSLNIALLYWMSLNVFRKPLAAFAFTATILIWQIISADVILQQLYLLADPILACLTLTATLLILGGWMKNKHWPQLCGYAVLGVAAFTKSIGVALLPMWVLFALCTLGQEIFRGKVPMKWRMLAVCLLLLIGPNLSWSARNFVVYGFFKPTAFTGINILPRVLPLMKDTDRLLNDPTQNEAFIRGVRTFEKKFGIGFNTYAWGGTNKTPSPIQMLHAQTQKALFGNGQPNAYEGIKIMFALDHLETSVALRIIAEHPHEYLSTVEREYPLLFAPFAGYEGAPAWLQSPAAALFQPIVAQLNENEKKTYFPPLGVMDLSRSDEGMRRFLTHVSDRSDVLEFLVLWEPIVLPWAVHGIVLLSVVMLIFARRSKNDVLRSQRTRNAAVCMLMMCMTAISMNAAMSVITLALARYSLPSEIPVNIAVLLAVCVIASLLKNRIFKLSIDFLHSIKRKVT